MELIIIAAAVGVSALFLVRRLLSSLSPAQSAGCGGGCGGCAGSSSGIHQGVMPVKSKGRKLDGCCSNEWNRPENDLTQKRFSSQ